MPDELRQILHDWAFNAMLECCARKPDEGQIAIGGAVLDLHDLDKLLDWLAVEYGVRNPDA